MVTGNSNPLSLFLVNPSLLSPAVGLYSFFSHLWVFIKSNHFFQNAWLGKIYGTGWLFSWFCGINQKSFGSQMLKLVRTSTSNPKVKVIEENPYKLKNVIHFAVGRSNVFKPPYIVYSLEYITIQTVSQRQCWFQKKKSVLYNMYMCVLKLY